MGAGWAARAERLLDELGRGHRRARLRRPAADVRATSVAASSPTARACAASVAEHGRRFGDPDLLAIGLAAQGRISLYSGGVPAGLALFDEAMVGVASGEVSPVFAGHRLLRDDRGLPGGLRPAARRGLDHRPVAVVPRRSPGWSRSPASARCTAARSCACTAPSARRSRSTTARSLATSSSGTVPAAGLALAERGDVLRLLGELDAAEESYERAAGYGYEPQPWLALLWLARGRTESALAAVRRLLAETPDQVGRSRLLPAAVEVLLAGDDRAEARAAALELEAIAHDFGNDALTAMAAACGRPGRARRRRPGRIAALPAQGARAVGVDAGALRGGPHRRPGGLRAARPRRRRLGHGASSPPPGGCSTDLGARPAADEAALLLAPAALPDGLTEREVEVLRLVASGRSNTADRRRRWCSARRRWPGT